MSIFDKWTRLPLPYYGPETEAGTPEPGATHQDPIAAEKTERRLSVRESLEDGFEKARKAEAQQRERDGKTGKFKPKAGEEKPDERPADAMRAATTEGEAPPVETSAEGETPPAPETPKTEAPTAWTKEAKAKWADLPPEIQAAVTKREADTQKGVDDLKAKYSDLDQALAPHLQVIRQHGHTPAQAVNQMFAWFQALSANPKDAFPALMKSFNYQQEAPVVPAVTEAKPGEQPPAGTPETSPAAQKAIDDLKAQVVALKQELGQQVTTLQHSFVSQQDAKTQEILANWSKDKPHYDKVRGMMAQLIQSGVIPLKGGAVDLDGAYEASVKLTPEIFAAEQAAQQAKAAADAKAASDAKKKADAEAAEKAKRAAASLTPAAPGAPGAAGTKPKKGKSVRESLNEAMDELRT